jgi:hypothetical protein
MERERRLAGRLLEATTASAKLDDDSDRGLGGLPHHTALSGQSGKNAPKITEWLGLNNLLQTRNQRYGDLLIFDIVIFI